MYAYKHEKVAYLHHIVLLLLIYYNAIGITNSSSIVHNDTNHRTQPQVRIPSFINKTTYTIHRVTGLIENIAYKRHIRHVDFTAAIINLKLNKQVYLEDFYGKVEKLPTETPLSRVNTVNASSRKKRREKNLGISGTISLECQMDDAGSRLVVPTYSNLFDDFKGKETTPPWHLVSLPHNTKASYGMTSSILNILEKQNPVIMEEIKELGNRNTTDTLYFALLLKYRDNHGTDMTSKLIASHGDDQHIHAALSKCFIDILSAPQQKLWPTKNYVDADTGDILYGKTDYLMHDKNSRSRQATLKTISVLSKHIIPENFAKSSKNLLNRYPRIKNSWHPSVPIMPHYCGLANGSLLESQALALRAKHEMAFLQTRNKKEQPIPELPDLIMQFLHAFIPGLMNNFLRQDTEKAAEDLSDQVPGDVLANVPEDELENLAQPLVFGVVTLLESALHHTIVESLSTELGMELGPKIGQVITQNIVPRMAKNIVPTLQQTIPEKVNKVIPYLMERALPIKLNKLLTLSVTHALVPTLTTALTRTPDQESEYYNNYYSAYYSDYYSNYYEKYYTDALESIENLQHPPSFQGLAKAVNIGLAPAGGNEGTAKSYDEPDLAVTASGTKLSEIQSGHDEFSGNLDLHG